MSLKKLQLYCILFLIVCVLFTFGPSFAEEDVDVEDDDDYESAKTKSSDKVEKPVKEMYRPPDSPPGALLSETFDGTAVDVFARWVKSRARKSGGDRYDGLWGVKSPDSSALEGDAVLVVETKARHHAIVSKLSRPFDFTSAKQLVVQYEVKFSNGMDCGGAYMKLLSYPVGAPEEFQDRSPYSIMFGPDKCGNDQKFHFIIRFPNTRTGKFDEKHMKKPDGFDLAKLINDKRTHLFTLVLSSDSSFEVLVDQKVIKSGSLVTGDSFDPPLLPPAEIDDPDDKKPSDWDERPKIADPDAKKPDDWDESEPEFIIDKTAKKPDDWLEKEEKMIPDPTGTKPSDWEEDMDGEWEAPLIENPKCASVSGCGKWEPEKTKNPKFKGKWSAPMIDNPAYKGVWKPRKISNPDYFEETDPYSKLSSIDAVGFELWTMTDGIMFDNVLIADSKAAADAFAKQTWVLKNKIENAGARSVVGALADALADRPWLWLVVILVIAIPCALIIAYCCFSSPAPPYKRPPLHKKTDEPTPDDEAEVEDDEDLDDDEDDDDMPPLEAQESAGGDATESSDGVRQRGK